MNTRRKQNEGENTAPRGIRGMSWGRMRERQERNREENQ